MPHAPTRYRALLMLSPVFLLAGCELFASFDRSKIRPDGDTLPNLPSRPVPPEQSFDGGMSDAGEPDAGDAGEESDAGELDAGVELDAGDADAGDADAGDAGDEPDAGDAGDGDMDSGLLDAAA